MNTLTSDYPYVYRLYGLLVRSQIELPEVVPVDEADDVSGLEQITITLGTVPDEIDDGTIVQTWFVFNETQCWYDFPESGRYLVEDGNRITVQPHETSKPPAIRAYLFGSVLGTLLHQRGLLPLHVSAVLSPSGVIAFTGDSGAGKSTLAGVVHERTGWPIVCDDVAVLRPDETDPILHCGIVRLKLLKDAVHKINKDPDSLENDGTVLDKFHIVAPEMFVRNAVPLHALLMLEQGETCELNPIDGVRSFAALTNAIYRPYLIQIFGDRQRTVNKCIDIAGLIETYSLVRPWSPDGITASVEKIQEAFGKKQ